jgi:phosphatidylglycerophosphate synthase
MVGLIMMLLFPFAESLLELGDLFLQIGLYIVYIGTVLTVVSGVDYFNKNKEIIMKSI